MSTLGYQHPDQFQNTSLDFPTKNQKASSKAVLKSQMYCRLSEFILQTRYEEEF